MTRLAALLCTLALAPLAALADSDKDESGHRHRHHHGAEFKEDYWVGNCKIERKLEKNGDYKEERKCKGHAPHARAHAPYGHAPAAVVIQAPVVMQPGIVIHGTVRLP